MSRQRRSRFTATILNFSGQEVQKVILAYNAEQVREFYARQFTVVSVVKGDLVNYPAAPAGPRWKLSDGIEDAKDFLGLTLPVRIKQTGHQGGRYGSHSLRIAGAGNPYHHITVKSWLDVEQAGKTLWHELTHCMQAERCAAKAGAVTTREYLAAWRTTSERAGAYRYRPIEVEARSYEAFNDEQPLAVQA